jgi:hypothetical protein
VEGAGGADLGAGGCEKAQTGRSKRINPMEIGRNRLIFPSTFYKDKSLTQYSIRNIFSEAIILLTEERTRYSKGIKNLSYADLQPNKVCPMGLFQLLTSLGRPKTMQWVSNG